MTTKKKIWYPGAIYHVIARGNRKDVIFIDKEDFNAYLNILEDTLIYYSHLNYEIIAYCLMNNHFHLIIKTNEEPLKNFMSRINSIYARYFNKKYDYVGHLFEKSYFSSIIQTDTQLLETSKYIHLNPVRAKIVELPEQYRWSSYGVFIGERECDIINPNYIWNYFDLKRKTEGYRKFVELVEC